MTTEEFEKLIDKDKYQVFIVRSPASLPFIFSVHPQLVVNKKGEISRYEIRHYFSKDNTYLHIDAQPPFQGLPLVWPVQKFFQRASLVKMIEGDENSKAKQLADVIENSRKSYPFLRKYAFLGANCATYVAWAINNFPEIEVKLPWNAIGKNSIK